MGKVIAVLTAIVIIVAGFLGWVMNVFHCLGYLGNGNLDSSAEVLVRIVGVFVPFIGAIAGYL